MSIPLLSTWLINHRQYLDLISLWPFVHSHMVFLSAMIIYANLSLETVQVMHVVHDKIITLYSNWKCVIIVTLHEWLLKFLSAEKSSWDFIADVYKVFLYVYFCHVLQGKDFFQLA